MENTETPQRINWRFRVPAKVWTKLEAADLSIFESKFKRVATSLDDEEQPAYVYVQFSTQNCGKTIAIQRLVACLIENLS
jgi:hypothetical protein